MKINDVFYGLLFVLVFGYELSLFSFERGININMPLFVPFMVLVTGFILSLFHNSV